jgi:predicted O-methyltransferase YrrM
LCVLELGMGASTLFLAEHASKVICFEHDPAWYDKIMGVLAIFGTKNVDAYLAERPYSRRIASTIGRTTFDLISIDGRDRVACLQEVLRIGALSEGGVIIIDNTERITDTSAAYAPMLALLSGLRVIHFEQIGPDKTEWQAPHRWLTTIAWRPPFNYTSAGGLL